MVSKCAKVAKAANVILSALTQKKRKPQRSEAQKKATRKAFASLQAYNRKKYGKKRWGSMKGQ
jgi:hypothetical protein